MTDKNKMMRFSPAPKILVFLLILFLGGGAFRFLFAQQKPCAKLLGGLHDDCIVIRGEERRRIKARIDMFLFPGDIIVQRNGLKEILISEEQNFQPHAIHPTAIWIDCTPPGEESRLPKFLRWLEILKSAEHLVEYAYSRNIYQQNINLDRLYPKPGWRASLPPDEPVLFSWESRLAKSFVVRDRRKEKEVFRKRLNSELTIILKADEIGLMPSKKYFWGLEVEGIVDIRTDYELKLLDDDIARIVKIGFEQIDGDKSPPLRKKLKQAAYLQFISDIYGNRADLYWKSGRILSEIDRDKLKDKKDILLYQLLLVNYKDHHQW